MGVNISKNLNNVQQQLPRYSINRINNYEHELPPQYNEIINYEYIYNKLLDFKLNVLKLIHKQKDNNIHFYNNINNNIALIQSFVLTSHNILYHIYDDEDLYFKDPIYEINNNIIIITFKENIMIHIPLNNNINKSNKSVSLSKFYLFDHKIHNYVFTNTFFVKI
jgi:hypothetical protein